MKLWHFLFAERCPKCEKTLDVTRSNALQGKIIKTCPNRHYQKEYHPALETYIEQDEVK
ncbi:hypothetical protein [Bacillus sp. NPDC077027]|uniref:hypothetical protein n=1 Tax=Bacillus sp. NPDC077027 TaxID=3390548 RepID=UPI003D057CAE